MINRHARPTEERKTEMLPVWSRRTGAPQQAGADRQAADAEPLENPAVEQVADVAMLVCRTSPANAYNS